MRRRTLMIAAPLGLGALVLAGAALATRGEASAPAPRVLPRARPTPRPEPPAGGQAPELATVVPAPTGVEGGGANALILERIRRMEEKVLELELKRASLVNGNQDLEKQVSQKSADLSARMMAEWRVRMLDAVVGLSETQKQSLLELWTQWLRDDAGRPAGREAWLAREVDLRSSLSVEQAARLHDSTSAQVRQMWSTVGRTIGGMIGASKDDQTRFQQTLGDYRAPNTMLMSEAYGADWTGLMREASGLLRPVLSADQSAKLDTMVRRF